MPGRKIELMVKSLFEITPTSPFHFDSTFYKPAHFPSGDNKWEPGKRWQTMLWNKQRLGLIYQNFGTEKKPKITVQIFSKEKLSPEFLESLKKEIIWRFNLSLDLSGFYKDVGNDPLLQPIIKKFRGLRPMHYGSLYEYLIIAIVLQNATVKRSVYMMQALFENYGTLLEFDNQKFCCPDTRRDRTTTNRMVLWCFWEPKVLANTDEQKLRNFKMGYRAKSLIRVSQPFVERNIDEFKLREKSAEEQEEVLLSLYGIGPASTGYIMFDVFHQWSYLKHISPWEQKIYTKIFFNKDYEKELVPVQKMLKYFEKWGKWKNLAIHYVWENIWWQHRHQRLPWLEKLIRS